MTAQFDVVIVGAGHAGAQLAMLLRQTGFAGSIAMIGDEPHPPYERPPLSKEFLSGGKPFDRILIRPEKFWDDKNVLWIGNERIDMVDPVGKVVTTRKGTAFGYGKLVWAAGGAARTLASFGVEGRNVHVVRKRADVDAIMAALPDVRHVTVIGGGYIGLEAAAVLRKLGKSVTLLETADRILSRVAGEPLSRFYEAEHRKHGVHLRLGARIASIDKVDDVICRFHTEEGEAIDTDMVIVGVGIDPEVGPLKDAGATITNGVQVDALCRTSLPDVYAIGDCAAHSNRHAQGAEIRLESVQNANDQARTVAAHLAGQDLPYEAIPWFWSNQYDLKLQTMGLSAGHDETIIRGDVASRSFSLLYLRGGKLIAIDAVNCVKDYVQAKALIVSGHMLDRARLGDASVPLKEQGHVQA